MQQSSIYQQQHLARMSVVIVGLFGSVILLGVFARDLVEAPLLAQALTWGVFWFTSVQVLRSLQVGEYLCGAVVRVSVSLFGGLVGWKYRPQRQRPSRLYAWFAGRMWAIDRRGAWRIGRPGDRRNLVVRVSVFGQVSPGDLGHIESL
ncbi:MAG: hypothetical protein HC828_04805 [Blastochloris sp.]|nr:hypothetical protein [Blastochloris sp.]